MQKPSFPTRFAHTPFTRLAVATGVVGLSLFGTVLVASAQTTTTSTAAANAPARTPLTQAQLDAAKACMAAKGFTMAMRGDRPGHGPDGTTATTLAGTATTTPSAKPVMPPLTAEQRTAREAAATACGLPAGRHGGDRPGGQGLGGPDGDGHGGRGGPGRGGPGGHIQLTDAQKACLAARGITLPTRPAAGSNTTGTRPAHVAPTDAERAARDAARTACGITHPTPPASAAPGTPTTLKTA